MLGDRWIPNYPTNKVLHPNHDLLGEMAVSDLINPEINVWRSEFIHSNFHRDDAEAICRIHLSRRQVADSIIWSYNNNGNFSVKSAYRWQGGYKGRIGPDHLPVMHIRRYGRFCGISKFLTKLEYLVGGLVLIYCPQELIWCGGEY